VRLLDRLVARPHGVRVGRLGVVLVAWLAAAAAPGPPADAQVCGLAGRPDFAGHQMPLDTPLETAAYTTVDAFPLLPDFTSPVFLTSAQDGSDRVFVVEQAGRVYAFPADPAATAVDRALYLDLSAEVVSGGEGGLLGLAFDPDFATNGRIYVDYTIDEPGQCSSPQCFKVIVERITLPDPGATTVSLATATRTRLVVVEQPYTNHNGGMIAFGPDGYLYVALGDGGLFNDPLETGQDTSDALGSILRIDPDDGSAPPSNPFVGVPGADPRVYHYGLRNPWRFSFDRAAPNDLWIGDVGQDAREEIDRAAFGVGGLNFGWDGCEGTRDTGQAGPPCATPGFVAPVLELPHPVANSITGGYVYRGPAEPGLVGTYVFSDYGAGVIWGWDRVTIDPGTGLGAHVVLATTGRPVASFGEDEAGELYIVTYTGRILRLAEAQPPGGTFPEQLSGTGFFSDTVQLVPAPGLVEYDVASPLWSDRAVKQRWLALPAGSDVSFVPRGSMDWPIGTAFVKHFELPVGNGQTRRLETRVFWRQLTGWIGATYRWNAAETDADLLRTGFSEVFDVVGPQGPEQQVWLYPSPTGCLGCHTAASGRVLGFVGPQLNHDFAYPAGVDNQLHALACGGVFDTGVGDPAQFPAHAGLADTTASRAARARAYLDSNCAHCHQPGGPAPGAMDMRAAILLPDMGLIGVAASEGDLGLPSPMRIAQGSADDSVLWQRLRTTTPTDRMAPGTLLPHSAAVDLFEDWIDFDLVVVDSDEDGVPDASDNCDGIPNPGQEDTGGDPSLGDACDPMQAAELVGSAVGPSAVALGRTVAVRGDTANAGPGASPAQQVRLYLSEDTAFDSAEDPLVGDCHTAAIAGGAAASCTDPAARVPADLVVLGPGETRAFHWVGCADGFDIVAERDETNNCTVSSTPVLVPEPGVGLTTGVSLWTVGLLAGLHRRHRARRGG
jgi:uncharacterized repeat protein (TIGR03806 family)